MFEELLQEIVYVKTPERQVTITFICRTCGSSYTETYKRQNPDQVAHRLFCVQCRTQTMYAQTSIPNTVFYHSYAIKHASFADNVNGECWDCGRIHQLHTFTLENGVAIFLCFKHFKRYMTQKYWYMVLRCHDCKTVDNLIDHIVDASTVNHYHLTLCPGCIHQRQLQAVEDAQKAEEAEQQAQQRKLTSRVNQPGSSVLIADVRSHEWVIPYTLHEDGTVTCKGLTPDQLQALTPYVLEGDKYHTGKGNSLRATSDEEMRLWDIFVQSLKTPEELFLDRVEQVALDDCALWMKPYEEAKVEHCEEMYDSWQKQYIADGDIPSSGAIIFSLRVYVTDTRSYNQRDLGTTVSYAVVHLQATDTFEILYVSCDLLYNEYHTRDRD